MNIAIVEDCREHSSILKHYIEEWSRNQKAKVQITEFANAEQFLFHNEEADSVDAVFMDIQMPGISGVELARKLREKNRETAIVFTTGIDDYIAEGYELEAMHYLIKPVSEEKIYLCLDKVVEKKNSKEQYIVLNGNEDTFRVALSKIWWVSAMGHNSIMAIEDEAGNVSRVTVKNSMGYLEKELLQSNIFEKSHRSYMVNLMHIRSISKTDVTMDNNEKVPLSRRMYQNVNESFIKFFAGKQDERWNR